MSRHWTHHIQSAGDPSSWYICSLEWEYDYEDGQTYVSDVDEPHVSAGMLFSTPEAARKFASKHGIPVRETNPIHFHVPQAV